MNATCRACGCSDERGCVRLEPGGFLDPEVKVCTWVEPDLCSACTPFAEEDWVHPPAEGEDPSEEYLAVFAGTVPEVDPEVFFAGTDLDVGFGEDLDPVQADWEPWSP